MTRSRTIEDLLREVAPQVLGAVVRRFPDFADCEDAVQDALAEGAAQWPVRGVPESAVGWLVHVASRRMVDRLRSEQARRRREEAVAGQDTPRQPVGPKHDDTLVLMLMCCHPALSPTSAIPLTLRAVGGLTTAEIARAFLVPEATMAQRISRAKASVKASGGRFELPGRDDLAKRVRWVLHVLYLIFNEGYVTSGGPALARADLSLEAIRLTRAIRRALPADPEVAGLLALMLLTEARRPARADSQGAVIPLLEQDRSLWDRRLIAEGDALISQAWARGAVGEYQLQAAIAAVHAHAARVEDTDWREIVALYGVLERMTANPMVSLNRAIAVSMVEGPEAGLALLPGLEKPLAGHHRLAAARAHLLEMAGDTPAAIAHYDAAAQRTMSVPEHHYLLMKAARLRAAGLGEARD